MLRVDAKISKLWLSIGNSYLTDILQRFIFTFYSIQTFICKTQFIVHYLCQTTSISHTRLSVEPISIKTSFWAQNILEMNYRGG